MKPSEKMARRAELFALLLTIDDDIVRGLTAGFGQPSLRAAEEARNLIADRRAICAEMLTVGYQPWTMPSNVEELKAI